MTWFSDGAEVRPHPWDPATSGQPYHRRRFVARPRGRVVPKFDFAVWAEANPGLGDLISPEGFESALAYPCS